MKLKTISNMALATGLMLGQVQPTDNYYEDDEDFDLVGAALSDGWSWGINQALADECSHLEGSARLVCEEQQLEHIEVTPEDELFEPDVSLGDLYNETDSIESAPPEGGATEIQQQEYIEVTDCESQVQQDYIDCRNTAANIANPDFRMCEKQNTKGTDDYDKCLSIVWHNYDEDIFRCETTKSDELTFCP